MLVISDLFRLARRLFTGVSCADLVCLARGGKQIGGSKVEEVLLAASRMAESQGSTGVERDHNVFRVSPFEFKRDEAA